MVSAAIRKTYTVSVYNYFGPIINVGVRLNKNKKTSIEIKYLLE